MALEAEIWGKDIQKNFYQGLDFLQYSIDQSEYIHGKLVHLPQAGGQPIVVKGRTVLPAPILGRVDTEITYPIVDYTTNPQVISDLETWQLTYPKRMELMGEHYSKLRDRIGHQALYEWAVSGAFDTNRIIRTTGAAGGALPPPALAGTAPTGNRRLITRSDIANLKVILDRDLVPQDERYLMMDFSMMNNDLLSIPEFINSFNMGSVALPAGVIGRIYGFNVITYSYPIVYANTTPPTKRVLDSNTGMPTVSAADDCLAVLAWSRYSVARAIGETKVYMDSELPEYYGDMISAMQRFGATIIRGDHKGTAALVQAVV